jgi:hypothetical protein
MGEFLAAIEQQHFFHQNASRSHWAGERWENEWRQVNHPSRAE